MGNFASEGRLTQLSGVGEVFSLTTTTTAVPSEPVPVELLRWRIRESSGVIVDCREKMIVGKRDGKRDGKVWVYRDLGLGRES